LPWSALPYEVGIVSSSGALTHPLERQALLGALYAIGAVALVASLGGAVRLLPWLLDPSVTFRLAAPFARGLLALALEAAVLVGWPLGWALGAARVVERGEGRVLATLGQSPTEAVLRLGPQAAAFAGVLGVVSFLGGLDASAPGRVVTDLIARGRESCAAAPLPLTYAVPFANVTWLCAPGFAPRLVGRGPGALASTRFTAHAARASGDLREIDLDDASVHLASAGGIDVRVGSLRLRGLSPFAEASSVPPLARALALVLAGVLVAAGTVRAVLSGALRGRFAAIVAGAAGSLATLGAMRWIDRSGGWGGGWVATLAVPPLALAVGLAATALLSRLPRGVRTASQ
jgi:hypothetical protein